MNFQRNFTGVKDEAALCFPTLRSNWRWDCLTDSWTVDPLLLPSTNNAKKFPLMGRTVYSSAAYNTVYDDVSDCNNLCKNREWSSRFAHSPKTPKEALDDQRKQYTMRLKWTLPLLSTQYETHERRNYMNFAAAWSYRHLIESLPNFPGDGSLTIIVIDYWRPWTQDLTENRCTWLHALYRKYCTDPRLLKEVKRIDDDVESEYCNCNLKSMLTQERSKKFTRMWNESNPKELLLLDLFKDFELTTLAENGLMLLTISLIPCL